MDDAWFRTLIEHAPAIAYVTLAGHPTWTEYVSPQVEAILGYSASEWRESPSFWLDHLHPDDRDRVAADIERCIRSGEPAIVEYRMIAKGGRVVWLRDYGQALRDASGRVILAGVALDISDRKEMEARLQASLREKEVLLREVHHRVRNKLQLVHSILNLQTRRITDPAAVEALRDAQNRVRLMALIHEKLCESPHLADIDFTGYLRDLIELVFRSYRERTGPIVLDVEAEPVSLPLRLAVPCGIILHELLSNCLRHAFVGRIGGRIRVELRRRGAEVLLAVEDDGVGIPPDAEGGDSLGFTLIRSLCDEIGGRAEVRGGEGTRVEVAFGFGGGESGEARA